MAHDHLSLSLDPRPRFPHPRLPRADEIEKRARDAAGNRGKREREGKRKRERKADRLAMSPASRDQRQNSLREERERQETRRRRRRCCERLAGEENDDDESRSCIDARKGGEKERGRKDLKQRLRGKLARRSGGRERIMCNQRKERHHGK